MTITATPSLEEMDNILKDQDKIMSMVREGGLGEFIKDYQDAKVQAHTDLAGLVKDQVEATTAQWLKDTGATVVRPNLDSKTGRRGIDAVSKGKGQVYNAKAPGAAIDRSDKAPEDLSEFLQGIWHAAYTLHDADELAVKTREWKKIQNSFGSVVPADGGFLVPEELRSDLLQLTLEDAIVRPRAQVIPMSSLSVPIPTVDETTRATSLFGGIVAYWTEEGAAATESQAKFGRVRLEAKKLTIYCEAPNELIADSAAFSAFISTNLPKAMAFEEDYAFMVGTGVGEPLGFLASGSAATIATTRTGSGNAIDFADVVNVYSRLLPSSYANAVWLCSPDVIPSLLQLSLADNAAWLTGGQAIAGAPVSLLGRPLYVTEKVPAAGTRGDFSLVDFSHYLIGDRQMIQAASSPHFKFSSDVTAYKVLERVDGRPWLTTALTPRNGSSNTLSPYVTVAT
jgi:HK97 family phage major capsid protein